MGFDFRDQSRFFLLSFLLILHTLVVYSQSANNTITQGQFIRDGQSILSPGKFFELGFFSPTNSTSRYVGIWYYGIAIQTVVWVANRDNPITGNSGLLGVGNDGNLEVTDGNGVVVWSTDSTSNTNSTAVLFDNGNLILSRGGNVSNDSNALWQSYDHPADTYLFNMKIHIMNALRGQNHSFVSWKDASDPSSGDCVMGMDPRAAPQIVTWKGSQRIWRSGHWNGKVFLGVPSFRTIFSYNYKLTREPNGNSYFTFEGVNTSALMNFRMQWNGVVEQLNWDEGEARWKVRLSEPSNECGDYNKCGNFGICSMTGNNRCSCAQGFVPKFKDQWNKGNWSGGCVRRTPLKCGTSGDASSDSFVQVERTKLPDHADSSKASISECENECLKNCSCVAYAFVDGIGCMSWDGDLVDVVEQSQVGGGTLHIRVARSELSGGSKSSISTIVTIIIALVGTIFLCVFIWLLWRFRRNLKDLSMALCKDDKPLIVEMGRSHQFSMDIEAGNEHSTQGGRSERVPLPLFSFQSVEVATENFSDENKLGQGGFGPVYKGTLPGGEEIAVKRLSRYSGQGVEEFKNELILIAELQHRNLVRLRGCCVEGEEKLLVYEYMPNKSLDWFLFDPMKKAQLDWRTRFKIIEGIARGLLYLHRDSRLRIIHRDLKVSNILLDEDMNPKISDFGMARIFGGNQNEANTNRVVGTYGYMSPEYAMEGLFSVKSDVYSFGVLLLEIVSGQRNNSFHTEECSNLIRYAWSLWKEKKVEELIDPSILKSCDTNEALQCIHVAMLCVQISALDRPTMANVVVMLESEKANFPDPSQPDFTSMRTVENYLMMQGQQDTTISNNDLTITQVTGR